MAQFTLISSADTMMLNDNATTNFGTQNGMYVGEFNAGAQIGRSLVKFDLSALAGKTVGSAVLKLYDWGSNYANNTRTMYVYRCKRAWVESEATWNVFSSGNNWGTAGAGNTTSDREATESGSLSIDATETLNEEYAITLANADIQAMVDGTYTNNGFVLKMDTESDDMHEIKTKEAAGGSEYHPTLVITTVDASGGNPIFFSSGGLGLS